VSLCVYERIMSHISLGHISVTEIWSLQLLVSGAMSHVTHINVLCQCQSDFVTNCACGRERVWVCVSLQCVMQSCKDVWGGYD